MTYSLSVLRHFTINESKFTLFLMLAPTSSAMIKVNYNKKGEEMGQMGLMVKCLFCVCNIVYMCNRYNHYHL